MKYSKQRDLILDYVNNSCEHPTAEMVYQNVQKYIPNISLGTVYRNLNVLCEHKMIRKIVDHHKIDRFDNVYDSHSHFQCLSCGQMIDIKENISIAAARIIENKTDNKILSHQMMFVGICSKCRNEREDI